MRCGDASVEFLGILVVLVIPVPYIVLAVAGQWRRMREAARTSAEDVELRWTPSTRSPWLSALLRRGSSSTRQRCTCSGVFLPAWLGGTRD